MVLVFLAVGISLCSNLSSFALALPTAGLILANTLNAGLVLGT